MNDRTRDWPSSLMSGNSFDMLGRAIGNEPGFPASASDVQKTRYVMSRLPDIAAKYGLKTGGPGVATIIGAGRIFDPLDPESNALMKGPGIGNCAEWSMFMQDVLRGAGVTASQVIYGDSDSKDGYSLGFTGTDTAIYVAEVLPDGRVLRRAFDPFRTVYHATQSGTAIESEVPKWTDRPLTEADCLPRDGSASTWLDRKGKAAVKGQDEKPLRPTTSVPVKEHPMDQFVGIWVNGKSKIEIKADGPRLSGVWLQGKEPRTAGKTMFATALPKAGSYSEFVSNTGYAYATDCPRLAPHTSCPLVLRFTSPKELTTTEKAPQYYSADATSHKPCSWALKESWVTKVYKWRKVSE